MRMFEENDTPIENWELRRVFGENIPMWFATMAFDYDLEGPRDLRELANRRLEETWSM